jgi:hypothetical protein
MYVGEFKEGKRHGQGTLISPDGTKTDTANHYCLEIITSKGNRYVTQSDRELREECVQLTCVHGESNIPYIYVLNTSFLWDGVVDVSGFDLIFGVSEKINHHYLFEFPPHTLTDSLPSRVQVNRLSGQALREVGDASQVGGSRQFLECSETTAEPLF